MLAYIRIKKVHNKNMLDHNGLPKESRELEQPARAVIMLRVATLCSCRERI